MNIIWLCIFILYIRISEIIEIFRERLVATFKTIKTIKKRKSQNSTRTKMENDKKSEEFSNQ